MPRGRKPEPGIPAHGHRMLLVKEPALWDWAIQKAAEQKVSLGKFVEIALREKCERER